MIGDSLPTTQEAVNSPTKMIGKVKTCRILGFVDRASLYNLVKITNFVQKFS
jgi:hypothetical protein